MEPLVIEMDAAPVIAVSVGDEPQPSVDAAVELLTVTLVGRTSVSEKLCRLASAGALNLNRPI